MNTITTIESPVVPCDASVKKMPGHWLLARMGKRVLRPGGLELTHRLLAQLAIGSNDEVVEFAPGLGVTARLTLTRSPKSCWSKHSAMDNLRPMVPVWDGAHAALVWMRGVYRTMHDYELDIVGLALER
jgi:hypothetical protein